MGTKKVQEARIRRRAQEACRMRSMENTYLRNNHRHNCQSHCLGTSGNRWCIQVAVFKSLKLQNHQQETSARYKWKIQLRKYLLSIYNFIKSI